MAYAQAQYVEAGPPESDFDMAATNAVTLDEKGGAPVISDNNTPLLSGANPEGSCRIRTSSPGFKH